jgi:hypothetical protein
MELEEENSALRVALNLPPASRPSLGKGPTGKDRPRPLETGSRSYPASAKSRESSNADLDSPPSTRTNSLSPAAMTSVRPSPRSAPTLDNGAWDQSLLMGEQHEEGQGGSTAYPLPPVSASMPQKGVHQYSFSEPMPPNPRNMGSSMYIGSQQSHYSPTADRPMASTYGSTGYIARDSREEQQYPYSQTQYPNHDSSMQSHSPTTTTTTHHTQIHHPRESLSGQSNVSYSQRRSNTEPHAFRAVLSQQHPHLPHPMQLNNSGRLPSPHGLPDSNPSSQRPSPHYGGVEGRLNSLP